MVQLDPLDPMGTNADLVAMARIRNLARGAIYARAYSNAFEHYGKERCLMHASAFAPYASEAPRRPAFRCSSHLARMTEPMLAEARRALKEHGPLRGKDLSLGRVSPIDWSGWKSTANAGRMALEVLMRRCEAVVIGRDGKEKLYDLPSRAPWIGGKSATPLSAEKFAEWVILDRVRAAGVLSRRAGIWWSSISDRRACERLIERGELVEIRLGGFPCLALPHVDEDIEGFEGSDEMRVLGPLDPLLWNRELVRRIFGFEYLWEVYKPAGERRWGWYVMPLLQHDQLVGRIEGRVEGETLTISRIWREAPFSEEALDDTLGEHAAACACTEFQRPISFDA